jgi:hypothetical protein
VIGECNNVQAVAEEVRLDLLLVGEAAGGSGVVEAGAGLQETRIKTMTRIMPVFLYI